MSDRVAIMIAGALIASAIMFTNHWQIGVAPGQVYRLDRWVGTVTACNAAPGGNGNMEMFTPGGAAPCERP
jgi:hypothetical protein